MKEILNYNRTDVSIEDIVNQNPYKYRLYHDNFSSICNMYG